MRKLKLKFLVEMNGKDGRIKTKGRRSETTTYEDGQNKGKDYRAIKLHILLRG